MILSDSAPGRTKRSVDDKFSGLMQKLGISSGNQGYRSSIKEGQNNELQKKLNSIAVSSLLTNNFLQSDPISVCFPRSLDKWKKKKKIDEKRPTRYSGEEDATCDVKIPDLREERGKDFNSPDISDLTESASEEGNDSSWDSLNDQITEDRDVFGKYPKVC